MTGRCALGLLYRAFFRRGGGICVKLHKVTFEADRNTGDVETSEYIASTTLYRPKFPSPRHEGI
jgi:hypothetical protein